MKKYRFYIILSLLLLTGIIARFVWGTDEQIALLGFFLCEILALPYLFEIIFKLFKAKKSKNAEKLKIPISKFSSYCFLIFLTIFPLVLGYVLPLKKLIS